MKKTAIKRATAAAVLAAIASSALLLCACAQTDVVGKVSATSFEAVLKKADVKKDDAFCAWSLEAPDKSARFMWSYDFKSSAPHDVMLEVDAKPFIDAGLDTRKLPAGVFVDGMLNLGQSLGDQAFPESAQKTAFASYQELLKLRREIIGYHEKLDHYGIDVGGGNKFEWAKDMSTNDKDIVFVLDPKLLVDAGANPAKVTGWAFAKVEVKDASGKTVEVDKFLKPFDFKA